MDARAKQILQILTSAVSFPAETPEQIKDDALADIIIFSHHAELGESLILLLKPWFRTLTRVFSNAGSYSMQSFVDIVVGQGVDPAKLVERTETRILKLFTDATSVPIKSVAFAEAAYRAARTLSFISPDALVQQFLSIAKTDLDPQHLDFIGTQELGIWNAPEGSLFVDGAFFPAALRPISILTTILLSLCCSSCEEDNSSAHGQPQQRPRQVGEGGSRVCCQKEGRHQ